MPAALCAALCWTCAAASGLPDCRLRDAGLERRISRTARQFKGEEYCKFRRYETLEDVDRDGKEDFIVFFTVEGIGRSSHFRQFMLVYLSSAPRGRPLQVQTGARGERTAERVLRTERNKIVVEDSVWLPQDALCCPSGTGRSTYELRTNAIVRTEEERG